MKKKKILLIAVLIMAVFVLSGCSKDVTSAIGTGKFKLEDIFIYPMAGLMWLLAWLSKNIFGVASYGVIIILATIVVRTMAWPIYAKSNDLGLKMKLVEPEAQKIQRKYKDKQDQQSQQRMQMEMMQLYKKYGIGLSGCIMPFIQMPIFIGFYRTISRMPETLKVEGHWLNVFDTTKFLGIDLTLGQEGSSYQKNAVIILAILVGITQVVSLIISQRRQKKLKEEQVSDIPEYRRQQNPNQKQTEMTMNIVMYGMTAMMVVFVLRSPAGLGIYWLIGNIYSTFQSYIGHINSAKRLEYLKSKH